MQLSHFFTATKLALVIMFGAAGAICPT